jgi:hypothetical protein
MSSWDFLDQAMDTLLQEDDTQVMIIATKPGWKTVRMVSNVETVEQYNFFSQAVTDRGKAINERGSIND